MYKVLLGTTLGALVASVTFILLGDSPELPDELPAPTAARMVVEPNDQSSLDRPAPTQFGTGDVPPGRPFTFNGRTYYVVPLE